MYMLTLILFQNIHAIGDRANAIILDAFENALKNTNVTALRPRLEHAQILRKNDMARLGRLGGKSAGPYISRSSYWSTGQFSHRQRPTYPCVS